MNLKAKIAAAASRGNIGPEKVNTIKESYKSVPKTKTNDNSYGQKVGNNLGKTVGYPKMQSTITETTKRKGTMTPMPTLKPTSVSVSREKRTDAPLAGNSTMGKTKGRRG